MKVLAVFTMKNLYELTNNAIYTMQTSNYPMDALIIDDYSDDPDTIDYLEKVEDVQVITEPMTFSLAGKWNIGARTAFEQGYDAVLICNNDILFHPQTTANLIKRMEQGDAGMVTAHNVRGALQKASDIFTYPVPETYQDSESPDFSCFMLSKATWETVGEFDERYVPCYFEDNDYHYRMKLAGIKAIVTPSAPYYHYGSRTQNSVPGGICNGDRFMANRQRFVDKFGVDPATYQPVGTV